MNPGLLFLPFFAGLLYLVRARPRYLFLLWPVLAIVGPTVRNRVGPVSVYWVDVVALVVGALLLPRLYRTVRHGPFDHWYPLLLGSLSVGMLSTILRYQAVLEPGFEMLRYCLSFLPLLVMPRVLRMSDFRRPLVWGFMTGAGLLAAVTVLQSLSPAWGQRVDTFLYGDFAPSENIATVNLLRDIVTVQQGAYRASAMYMVSTTLSGAAVFVMVVLYQLRVFGIHRVALMSLAATSVLVALLSYSRHGLVAIVLFMGVTLLLSPRRGAVAIVVGVLALALSTSLVSEEFWQQRIARGGLEDHNIALRLTTRPAELVDRIIEDPLVVVMGAGLSIRRVANAGPDANYGFASNSFLLPLFFSGLFAFMVYLLLYLKGWRSALRLRGADRATSVAAIVACGVLVSADNYVFFHNTMPFLYSTVLSLITVLERPQGTRASPSKGGGVPTAGRLLRGVHTERQSRPHHERTDACIRIGRPRERFTTNTFLGD